MTTIQILGVAAPIILGLLFYAPSLLKLMPAKTGERDRLKDIANILSIQDSYEDSKVKEACQLLLQTLIR